MAVPRPISFKVDEAIYDIVRIDGSTLPVAGELDGEPVELVYKKMGSRWERWVVITRSALLRRLGLPGRGVYAWRSMKGPSEAWLNSRKGTTIGYYQEGAHAIDCDLDEFELDDRARFWIERGRDKLLIAKPDGETHFYLFDGDSPRGGQFPPWYSINDCRGTGRTQNVELLPNGQLRTRRNIRGIDETSAMLAEWEWSELCFDYKAGFWKNVDRGARPDKPIVIDDSEPVPIDRSIDWLCDLAAARLAFTETGVKRPRGDGDEGDEDDAEDAPRWNPYEDPLGAMANANARVLSSTADDEATSTGIELLREFLVDQAAACFAVVVDCETQQAASRDRSPSDLPASCTTALFLERADSEVDYVNSFQFWPSDVPRGAPYDLLDSVLDAANRIVAYNGVFDLKVLAKRRPAVYERWTPKLFDPFKLIRDAGIGTFKLDALLQANDLSAKSGSGLDAVRWWEGNDVALDKLALYNVTDVVLLAELCQRDSIRLPSGDSTVVGTFGSIESAGVVNATPAEAADPRTLEQRTAEWFEARRGKITASVAPSLLGVGFDRREVVFEMLLTGKRTETTDNMLRGQALEGKARAFYERVANVVVEETGLWIHSEFDWLAASPDGLVGQRGLLEIKAPKRVGKLSDAVIVQSTIQMACTERTFCDICQFSPPEAKLQRLRFDADLFETLVEYLRPVAVVLHEALQSDGGDEEAVFTPTYGRMELNEVKMALEDTRRLFLEEERWSQAFS